MTKQIKNQNFIIQGTILAVASVLVRIIGLVYRVPLTAILGNEGNGIYSAAYEIYSILLLVSSYSLPLAVSKLVSATLAKGSQKNAHRYFKAALVLAVIVGVIVALFTFFAADFLAGELMKSPLSTYSLKVLAPTLFIVAVMGVFRGYFQGLGSMVPTAISQIFEQIVNAIVSVVAAKVLFDVGKAAAEGDLSTAYGAAGGTLGTGFGALAGLITLILIYLMYRRIVKRKIRRDQTQEMIPYRQMYKLLFVTIAPVILSTAIYNVSNVLDQGVFNNLMNLHGFSSKQYNALWGIFSGKYRVLTNVPIAVASAVASSAIPSITVARVSGERTAVRKKIHEATKFTMVIAFPCAVGLSVLAGPILNLLWGGTDNAMATVLLQYGSISVVLYSLSTLSNGILQGLNKMRIPVTNAFFSLIAHLAVLVVCLQVLDLGIHSVVIANLFFAAMMCVLNAAAIRKYSNYHQEVTRTFVLPLLASVIMGAAAYLVHLGCALVIGTKAATLVAIVAAVVVYFVVLIKIGGLTRRELRGFPMGSRLTRVAEKLHLLSK